MSHIDHEGFETLQKRDSFPTDLVETVGASIWSPPTGVPVSLNRVHCDHNYSTAQYSKHTTEQII